MCLDGLGNTMVDGEQFVLLGYEVYFQPKHGTIYLLNFKKTSKRLIDLKNHTHDPSLNLFPFDNENLCECIFFNQWPPSITWSNLSFILGWSFLHPMKIVKSFSSSKKVRITIFITNENWKIDPSFLLWLFWWSLYIWSLSIPSISPNILNFHPIFFLLLFLLWSSQLKNIVNFFHQLIYYLLV